MPLAVTLAGDELQTVAVFLGAAVAALVAVVGMTVAAVVAAKRAVRRRLDRHVPKVRGFVEDASLKVRAYARTGSPAEVARVRSSLRTQIEQTRRVLDSGIARDAQLGEAVRLLGRLDAFARDLDADLALLERETDAERVRAHLPVLRERAERIEHSAGALRWAARDRERQLRHDELEILGEQVEQEVVALRESAADTRRALGPLT